MTLLCSISNSPCVAPVVSPTGHVFDKRVILSMLTSNGGVCPVTGAQLSEEQLIDIRQPKANMMMGGAVSGGGFVGMLQNLQTEWDALMVETYTLKQSLEETRRELSQALYQNDAAVRVIARVTMERDQARQLLAASASAPSSAVGGGAVAMDTDGGGAAAEPPAGAGALQAEDLEQLMGAWKALQAARKVSKGAAGGATAESVAALAAKSSTSLHKSSGTTGICCLAVSPSDDSFVLTGGRDKQLVLFNRSTGVVASTVSSGPKAPTAVSFHPTSPLTFLSSSEDGSVRLYSGADAASISEVSSLALNSGPIVDASFHPTGLHAIACSGSGQVLLLSCSGGRLQLRATLASSGGGARVTAGALHPDGLIYATAGVGGEVVAWDVRSGTATRLRTGREHTVTALVFSHNGYHLAAGDEGGAVTVLDLRKGAVAATLWTEGEGGGAVSSLSFDGSGKVLAFLCKKKGGVSIVKEGGVQKTIGEGGKGDLTALGWFADGGLCIGASDRTLRVLH